MEEINKTDHFIIKKNMFKEIFEKKILKQEKINKCQTLGGQYVKCLFLFTFILFFFYIIVKVFYLNISGF